MESAAKPWIDLDKYREDRLREAVYEAELALRFLENGLYRNAAGKAFQAAKALLAAAAAQHRERLAGLYPGERKMGRGRRAAEVDLVIALMPTTRMKEVAQHIGDKELELAVEKALDLHQFQHNGLNPEGVLSRYRSLDQVKKDVEDVVEYVRRAATRRTT
ncbi:PaREP1 domain containing protein [Thermoproteus uzoniensis 768-20]|uniref:PaREP1 domain containing protein n=1 Tax=Thermoproteus uzoniensis (strain 768-20) TaxID=999630 RepID=F2L1E3_THEU7|nr:PaREP1 family protein [Thermoproteus uzoniensis]AEA11613.1 PaREP1 domain containing protein [Thermoproteus uzoniensis 768-20]